MNKAIKQAKKLMKHGTDFVDEGYKLSARFRAPDEAYEVADRVARIFNGFDVQVEDSLVTVWTDNE